MDHVREDFRLTVDLQSNTIDVHRVQIVQLVPQGGLFYRQHDGGLRPLDSDDLHSGDRFVVTKVYSSLADAKTLAAAELQRRGMRLLALAERCAMIEETING